MNFLQNLINPLKSNRETASNEEDLEKIAAQEQKLFSFETLVAATKDFHPDHKLGDGGFGPVYKGKLENGREIAVKKLWHCPIQGKKEFINEARQLARVQHRNVVSMMGYCANGLEKFLVYDYVLNESLDKVLFDTTRGGELDWKRRFDIIAGLARGLLYLHEDSHRVVIHRDIKATNILLDDKWTPKITDFGMARLFPEDQTHVNTRVGATNGYMAPEYVMHGQLSVKADVFSFGVVMLELISGHKNSSTFNDPDAQNLLEWVWKLYKNSRSSEIIDPILASAAATDQVAIARCIQIGLLCAQADPELRPNMRRVVVMLSKKPVPLEEPTRPGYPGSRYRRTRKPASSSGEPPMTSSTNTSSLSGSSGEFSSRSFSTSASETSFPAGSSGEPSSRSSPMTSATNTSSTSILTNPKSHSNGKRPMNG